MSIATKKILVIAPSWIGDMVMAQALFKLIKQQQPDAQIDVVATTWNRPLVDFMPEVTQVFIAPFKHGELRLRERFKLAQQLRAQQYDQAIVIPNSFKSALIPFFARIPQRSGWRGEMRWGLLNDVRYLDKKKLPQIMQRYMALALPKTATLPAQLLQPTLHVSEAAIKNTLTKYQLANTNQPILILSPGAERGSARRWPQEYYAQIAAAKIKSGWQIWLLGSIKDKTICDAIQTSVPECINFSGKTSLAEAVHLSAAASYVISNDSGLMHIAGALNKPLIVIYGSTPPEIAPPMSTRNRALYLNLPCSPCFKRECPLKHLACMYEIKPEQVLQELEKL